MSAELSRDELLRYSRHLLIPQVGLDGQRKLKAASVLVVGAGGLGSPAALYLAAAGVGRIGLVDYDVVDASNLQRQVIHGTSNLGQLKVESARSRLLDLNPGIDVPVYNQSLTSANALRMVQGYDLVIDGTDNFPTRYLVNDVCVKLGIPNVYGSIFRFDGQVSVFAAKDGPCYRCLFPDPPPPGSVPSCAEGGVLGVLPGIIGSLQAGEGLKLLLGIGESLVGKLLLFHALDMRFDTIKLRKDPNCVVCSLPSEQIKLIDYEAFCGVPAHDHDERLMDKEFEITPQELAAQIQQGHSPRLIDVREPHELHISQLPNAELIPLGELPGRLPQLDPSVEMVILCRSGSRSERAVEFLRAAGFTKVKNLVGGINAWAQQVDPDMVVY
ncbi:MAG: molybdopterin-synthase adenylyltransferase MoeB [Anaerolineales bacterium]|nr:molybdopterin-synthase adenylyltransferase MoeB [Anaerolineales bacterium]